MSELVAALEDPSLPLVGRLKVACYLWQQDEMLSSDLLLGWVCNELCQAYNRKSKTTPPPLTCSKLWQFLCVVLEAVVETDSVQDLDLSPLNTHLFQGMGVVFSSAALSIGEDGVLASCAEEALKCLHAVFRLPTFPSSLTIFETMVSLLESSLRLGVACFRHTHSLELQGAVVPALASLLEYYVYLEGRQANCKKVFTATCNQLLCLTLQLNGLVESTPPEATAPRLTAIRHALGAIFKSLFRSDLLSEYSSALSCCWSSAEENGSGEKRKEKRGRSAVSSTRLLFDVLEQFLHSEENENATNALPILFGAFLHENSISHKVPKSIEFNFFVRVVDLLGILEGSVATSADSIAPPTSQDLTNTLTSFCNRKKRRKKKRKSVICLESKLLSYQRCLDLVSDYDLYQVAQDMGSDQMQTKCFQRLVECTMKELHPETLSLQCGCLCKMKKLNHLLLEPWLPVVWALVPITSTAQETPTTELIGRCIETYAKLRQLLLLLDKQMEAAALLSGLSSDLLTTSSPEEPSQVAPMFSPSSERLLAGHIASLPPGQVTELMQTHIQYLQEHSAGEEDSAMVSSMELLSLLLCHSPPSLWSGRCKAAATDCLHLLLEDICHKMIVMATTSHPAAPSISLSTCALLLVSECCEVMLRLLPLSCVPLEEAHWPLDLDSAQQLLSVQWVGVALPQQPPVKYVMKCLAIQQLKFDALNAKENSRREDILDFVFLPEVLPDSREEWNGQVLSLTAANYCVGYWSYVFSHLPSLYDSCNGHHLATVADCILGGILLEPEETRGGDHTLTLSSVISCFLASESFLEMKLLHRFIFSRYLSARKWKSLPKPLRSAMKWCAGQDTAASAVSVSEGFAGCLRDVLQYGVETVRGGKNSSPCDFTYKTLLVKWKMEVYLKLMTSLPWSYLPPGLVLQCLLVGVVYHVALLQLLVTSPGELESDEGDPAASLSSLTYLVMWCLRAVLSTSSARGRKAAKKLLMCEEVDVLLGWWYTAILNLHTTESHAHVCDVLVSLLVAMELTLDARVCCYGYPQQFTIQVAGDLKDDKPVFLVGRVLLTLVNVMSRAPSLKLGDHAPSSRSGDHNPSSHMCEVVLNVVERVSSSGGLSAIFTTYRHLISLLAGVVNLDPTQDCSRVCQIANLLWKAQPYLLWKAQLKNKSRDETFFSTLRNFELLSGILDYIALRTLSLVKHPAQAAAHPAPPTQAAAHPAPHTQAAVKLLVEESIMELATSDTGMELVSLWNEVQCILRVLFEELPDDMVGSTLPSLRRLAGRGSRESPTKEEEERKKEKMFQMILKKICALLLQVLNGVCVEELVRIVEPLHHQNLELSSSMATYCVSWLLLLDTKLPQQVKGALRPHLPMVLTRCLAITEFHARNNHSHDLVVMSVLLAGHVISIPSHVGVHDEHSVLLALQLCSSPWIHNTNSLLVVEACLELLTAILRQHSTVINHTPAPFITATNKLVSVVVVMGQRPEAFTDTSTHLTFTLHCASLLSRVMEVLSHQKSLYRFFVPIVHEFLVSSQKSLLHHKVKECLVAGVFSLVKLFTPSELAFLQASLDSHLKHTFHTLLKHFQKEFKYGGGV